jgi:hypothetical protein
MIAKLLRNNSWPVILLLSLAVILGFRASLQNAADNSTLYIRNITGDPSVLNDVTITGVLKDKYHGMQFEINDGKVRKSFNFHEHKKDIETDPDEIVYANSLLYNGRTYIYELDYSISPDANVSLHKTEEGSKEDGYYYRTITTKADLLDIYARITSVNFGGNGDKAHLYFKMDTDITLKGDAGEFEFSKTYRIDPSNPEAHEKLNSNTVEVGSNIHLYRSSTRYAHGLVQMDGTIYFTVITTHQYSGTNGIYAIEKFSTIWESMYSGQNKTTGNARTVTTFSLNDHNTAVLGLEAVDGKLVLIMSIDNVLTLRAYDPLDGRLIGELAITEINNAETLEDYREYIDGSILILAFKDTIVSVEIGDDIELRHWVQGIDHKNEYLYISINKVYDVNDRLYVFSNVNRRDEGEYSYQELRPKHFMLHVFSANDLLYIGEFINDSDEDYEADRHRSFNSFGYNYYKYRHFESVSVEGR